MIEWSLYLKSKLTSALQVRLWKQSSLHAMSSSFLDFNYWPQNYLTLWQISKESIVYVDLTSLLLCVALAAVCPSPSSHSSLGIFLARAAAPSWAPVLPGSVTSWPLSTWAPALAVAPRCWALEAAYRGQPLNLRGPPPFPRLLTARGVW